jgi:hypothetical protein
MGVNHRRGHIFMAQQFLDRPDIITGFQLMRRPRKRLRHVARIALRGYASRGLTPKECFLR